MSKSTAEIRQTFLDFFASNGHQVVSSSSLVPTNDPTLLFTNAGMNQFKDVFLGLDKRNYSRATSSQRCVRAGGKHNDLENVGYTARHHTFFEMLGNFSFGDYFKKDAITLAWELLTSSKWFHIPSERLWVTVYHTDDEAYDIWHKEIGVPSERIIRIGDNKGAPYASDNFWQMGDTGPCGPCTEIFYDHGEHLWGGPPGSPEEDGDRYIEIWNIVFMQFNRLADGTMQALPAPSVDTGMGLERISAVLQHVNSNYEIDLFETLIKSVAKVTNANDLESKSLRVIADHIRSCAFLIADGVIPSNENRGYVLRRIIRRAVRHGNMLGAKETFFYKLVAPLIDVMGSAAEELKHKKSFVEEVLKKEEEQFARTLERGLSLLDDELQKLQGDTLDGETAFRLYDTYGFPLDLTADVCREKNLKVDEAAFEHHMELQRQRAREASSFNTDYNQSIRIDNISDFVGYSLLQHSARVIGLFIDGIAVDRIQAGDNAVIVLDKTTFYAESGGQVGDLGTLENAQARFSVSDTQKYGKAIGHLGQVVHGALHVGDIVLSSVDELRRQRIRLNHSATHLLHAALRKILGEHVLQKGSLVNDRYLRFDFSHSVAMSTEQIRAVENTVNEQIRNNLLVKNEVMNLDEAQAKGAMALFGEKCDDDVHVLSMGNFSMELCGGTHVAYTGDIGLFCITNESGTAAGIRRIEAVTGTAALEHIHQQTDVLNQVSALVKANTHNVSEKVQVLLERAKILEKEVRQLKEQQAVQGIHSLAHQALDINGVKLLVKQIDNVDTKTLRIIVDDLKNQLKSAVIILATVDNDKVHLIAGVTEENTKKVKAGEIISQLAQELGGKGGGNATMAQAGGSDVGALSAALVNVEMLIKSKL